MRKTPIAAACILAFTAAQAAETIRTDAPVTAAVLYLNGADVTRTAEIYVPEAGVYDIEIVAVDGSEQVQAEGAVLQGQSTRPAGEQADEIAQKENEYTSVKSGIEQRKALADNLIKSLNERPENYDKVYEQVQQLHAENDAARLKAKELQTAIDKLKAGGGDTAVYTIAVKQPGTVYLHLNHFTNKAGWAPYSVINLKTAEKTVDFTAYANVYQNGSAWKNVKLTLALTPPHDAVSPQLRSMYVEAVKPQEEQAAPADYQTTALYGSIGFNKDIEQPQAMSDVRAAAAPEIMANGVDFRIELPNTYSIEQDAKARLPYYQAEAKADISTAVYGWGNGEVPVLLAEWTQPEPLPFLAGSAEIQRSGLFIGERAYFDFWKAGEKMRLSFGADPAFTAEVSTPPGYTDKTGIFNKRKVSQTRNRVTIKNIGAADRPVVFYARVPQAGNSDTEVKPVFSSKPSDKDVENTAGIYRWNIGKIAAGKEWTLDYGYDISYPEEMQLQ